MKDTHIAGAEMLRELVGWVDHRPEFCNEGKTLYNLIQEFITDTGAAAHWYGGTDHDTMQDIVGFQVPVIDCSHSHKIG